MFDIILTIVCVALLAIGWIRYLHVVVDHRQFAGDTLLDAFCCGVMLVLLAIVPLAAFVGLAMLWDEMRFSSRSQ